MVGCGLQRASLRGLFCTVQPDVVLLDRASPACRRNLVFWRGVTLWLASKSASRLCRRPDFLLDRILLAHDGHRSRLVCSCVLHGDLFGDLGVVLRFVPATSGQEAITCRGKMGPDAHPSSNDRGSRAIAVDKIDKQLATCFHPRGGMDHVRMVARLGFLRFRLEWPRCRTTRLLAVNSNYRTHRCGWAVVRGCVCQRDPSHDRVSPGCRSTHTRDATAF